jgi:hypothetical protein
MKLKGLHFETMSDIQRESQAVLNSIKENDFHGGIEAWKKTMETILKERAAKIEYVKPAFFYVVWELSDTPPVRERKWGLNKVRKEEKIKKCRGKEEE